MVEIILRDDIAKYEPKFLFGMTKRQATVTALAILVSAAVGLALYKLLGVPLDVGGVAVVIIAAAIAVLGLHEKGGVYLTRSLPLTIRYRMRPECIPHACPELTIRGERAPVDGSDERRQAKRQARLKGKCRAREARSARRETEFCDTEGRCIRPKQAAALRGVSRARRKPEGKETAKEAGTYVQQHVR